MPIILVLWFWSYFMIGSNWLWSDVQLLFLVLDQPENKIELYKYESVLSCHIDFPNRFVIIEQIVERQSVLPGSFKREAIVLVHDSQFMIVLNVRITFIHSKDAIDLARTPVGWTICRLSPKTWSLFYCCIQQRSSKYRPLMHHYRTLPLPPK